MARRARWRRWRRAVLGLLGAFALPLGAQQSGYPPQQPGYPPQQPGSADEASDSGISQSVARISYLNGNVSFARGDDPDQWQDADVNVPMTIGDRVYTGEGSLELQLEHGAVIDLGARTDLATLNLTEEVSQLAVKSGVASFSVPRLLEGEIFEIDTPNAAITFDRPGRYRVDVDESGQTRVVVRRGDATVAAGGGQLVVGDGESIMIEGTDAPRYEVVATPPADRWDAWAESRQDRELRSASLRYVSPGVVGASDLDAYGRWDEIPQYGRVWSPASVAPGWAPYREGHWTWQDPWGWTWISTEPWGWAPYHYGRWVNASSRWYWVPVAPTVATVAYAPALVAFVGGPVAGVGIAVSAPAYVGWFPLAPHDPLNPWWGPRRAQVNVTQVTNVTYVNRTYVTVVNQNAFVSGNLVAPAIVRETTVMRQVAASPVVVGRVPVLPTASSTRIAIRTATAPPPRPPATVVSRAVVTRSVPPPAPPRFDQKLAVIRESRAPVTAPAAARLAPKTAAPVVPFRSAVAEAGNVRLAPAQPNAARQKQVEPVTASRAPAARAPQPPGGTAGTAREAQRVAPTPARPQPGAESRPQPGSETRSNAGAEARPGTAPAPLGHPTAPALEGRRPDEPALSVPREGLRPTPSYLNPNNDMNRPPASGQRENAAPPPAREAHPQRETAEAPPRGMLRPTPSYSNPHNNRPPASSPRESVAPRGQAPTPPARVNPEREAAPPTRENPAMREAAPPRPAAERESVNPAPHQGTPGRVPPTPNREGVHEAAPERGAQAHPQEPSQSRPQPAQNRGRRPTPHPTPRPE